MNPADRRLAILVEDHPLVYEVRDDLTPVGHSYVGDPGKIEQAIKDSG